MSLGPSNGYGSVAPGAHHFLPSSNGYNGLPWSSSGYTGPAGFTTRQSYDPKEGYVTVDMWNPTETKSTQPSQDTRSRWRKYAPWFLGGTDAPSSQPSGQTVPSTQPSSTGWTPQQRLYNQFPQPSHIDPFPMSQPSYPSHPSLASHSHQIYPSQPSGPSQPSADTVGSTIPRSTTDSTAPIVRTTASTAGDAPVTVLVGKSGAKTFNVYTDRCESGMTFQWKGDGTCYEITITHGGTGANRVDYSSASTPKASAPVEDPRSQLQATIDQLSMTCSYNDASGKSQRVSLPPALGQVKKQLLTKELSKAQSNQPTLPAHFHLVGAEYRAQAQMAGLLQNHGFQASRGAGNGFTSTSAPVTQAQMNETADLVTEYIDRPTTATDLLTDPGRTDLNTWARAVLPAEQFTADDPHYKSLALAFTECSNAIKRKSGLGEPTTAEARSTLARHSISAAESWLMLNRTPRNVLGPEESNWHSAVDTGAESLKNLGKPTGWFSSWLTS